VFGAITGRELGRMPGRYCTPIAQTVVVRVRIEAGSWLRSAVGP
jgi:hypothetical protein